MSDPNDSAARQSIVRQCLRCAATEAVPSGQPIWPLGWKCSACHQPVAECAGFPLLAPALAIDKSNYDPDLFSHTKQAEPWHFWFVTRRTLIVGLAERYFSAARTLMEIGCGSGATLRALERSRGWDRIVGSDLHVEGLAIAREQLHEMAEFIQMDATRIPICRSFDLIGAFDVLEHVPDDVAAIQQMAFALRPGGGVIVTVPQHPWLWSHEDEVASHQRRYRLGELEEKLKRSGFRIIFSTSFVSLLLPVMIVSRLVSRHFGRQRKDLSREFAIGAIANFISKAVTRVEVGLSLRGMRWPIGGSRVIVARLE